MNVKEFDLIYSDWMSAMAKTLSPMARKPGKAYYRDVDFILGCPSGGKIDLYVIIDGVKKRLCAVNDIYPPFDDMKRWMNDILRYDSGGRKFPCSMNLDCISYSLVLTMAPAGEKKDGLRFGSMKREHISQLTIHMSGQVKMLVSCYCGTYRTVSKLYKAVMECLEKHERRFDTGKDWHICREWDIYDGGSASKILHREFYSPRIESIKSD